MMLKLVFLFVMYSFFEIFASAQNMDMAVPDIVENSYTRTIISKKVPNQNYGSAGYNNNLGELGNTGSNTGNSMYGNAGMGYGSPGTGYGTGLDNSRTGYGANMGVPGTGYGANIDNSRSRSGTIGYGNPGTGYGNGIASASSPYNTGNGYGRMRRSVF